MIEQLVVLVYGVTAMVGLTMASVAVSLAGSF